MHTSPNDTGLLGRFFDWVKDRVGPDDGLYALTRGDFAMMASDLGICESDLREVLPKTADNAALMDEVMRARGLDPDRVRRMTGGLARELEMTCSRCDSVARCRRALALGTAAVHAHEFCGNAEVFDELRARA